MKRWERLPEHIDIKGRRYRVDLDFRNILRMMEVLGEDNLLPAARDYRALRCVMRRPPKDAQAALAAVREICFPDTGKAPAGPKLTSFSQDADLIRAAFRQAYNIDLWREKLHWVEFSALLAALPEGSRYSEILGIRARPMPKATKYNAEERAWLAQAKARCAIRLDDKEQARAYDEAVRNVFAVLYGIAKAKEGEKEHGVHGQ